MTGKIRGISAQFLLRVREEVTMYILHQFIMLVLLQA